MFVRQILITSGLFVALSACGARSMTNSSTPTTPATPITSAATSPSTLATPTTSTASTLAPEERQVSGIIDYFRESQQTVVTAPATINVNTPFEISISTFGSGCERSGGANVRVAGLQADVEVYDYTTRNLETHCTQELKRLSRSINLQFAESGEARIIIHGVRVGPESSSMDGVPTTLEQTIIVQ